MIHTDAATAAPAIAEQLANAQRILVLTHINPDGDAIGSMLATAHVLTAMGKTALPLASSSIPGFLYHLPGIEQVQVYRSGTALPAADLVWMVDTANPQRVGPLHDEHAPTFDNLPLLIVDHHVTNDGHGTVNLIDSQAASCAEVLYPLFRALNAPVSPAAATCLLMGLTTDTQSFQTSSTRPQTLRTAAELIEAGADNYAVVQQAFYTTPYSTAHLVGLSLSHLQHEDGLVWTHITQEMTRQTQADDAAYDDVLHVMQRIAGLRIGVLFKERGTQEVKISLRSKPGIDVSAVAKTWGGGGHTQAAGATLHMDLAAACNEVLPILRDILRNGQ